MNQGILYILVRNDLPSMNPGKAMAQASHASSQFVYENLALKNDNDIECDAFIHKWIEEGNGFGTTIVLEGDKDSIDRFIYRNDRYKNGKIIDETYPFQAQKELLDLITDETKKRHKIVPFEDAVIDSYGRIPCYRKEHTCSWLFFYGDEESYLRLKEDCKELNIKLHR